ncbi:hypothetical protein VTN96DRAFT_2909 [Rasamsonia emersonii]
MSRKRKAPRDASPNKRALNDDELIFEVLKVATSKDPELMILKLMESHSFSFARLKELLIRNGLEISFSKVKYVDIAPRVGLDPLKREQDIPLFDMFRARLPNEIFRKIIEDIDLFSKQYGTMDRHENGVARARISQRTLIELWRYFPVSYLIPLRL